MHDTFCHIYFLLRVNVALYVVIILDSAMHLISIPPPPIDADAVTRHFFGACNDLPDSDVSPPLSRQTFVSPGIASDDDT